MRWIRDRHDMSDRHNLLDIRDLTVEFATPHGSLCGVRGLSLQVAEGECLAVVGESGSGKSQTFLATLGLLAGNGRARGSIKYDGREILNQSDAVLNTVRGPGIGFVSQDPMNALTPHLKIGQQMTEAMVDRGALSRTDARERALELLRFTGISEPDLRLRQYPHEFSGGMRQRVAIAMALMPKPRLLIADEPTTALDVTVQARIVALLAALRNDGLGIVLVTHDLGVVAGLADRVAVMYAGGIVEIGPSGDFFTAPLHPYAAALRDSVPRLDITTRRLQTIDGQPPRPGAITSGCAFAPRCRHAQAVCRDQIPPLRGAGAEREVACHFPLSASDAAVEAHIPSGSAQ